MCAELFRFVNALPNGMALSYTAQFLVINRFTTVNCPANCQDFTTDLLQAVDVKVDHFDKDSKIKKFLDKIDQMEKNDLGFEYTFSDGETMSFKKHSQLDLACYDKVKGPSSRFTSQLGTNPDTTSEEYRLLKSFDRVFWLRYYGVLESKTLTEEEKVELFKLYKCHLEFGCYFKGETTCLSTTEF